MSILVTGGAGYIGSHVVLALLDAAHEVIVLDNLSTGIASAVAQKAPLVRGDIGDQELVGRLLRQYHIDSVMHFAGSIVVPESVSDPLKYYWNNTAKSCSLIESCVKNDVKNFIFSSTAAVYGPNERALITDSGVFVIGHESPLTRQLALPLVADKPSRVLSCSVITHSFHKLSRL